MNKKKLETTTSILLAAVAVKYWSEKAKNPTGTEKLLKT